jgi:hypothetical protein
MDLSGALETIWTLVRRLNRYVEEQAPWKLAKDAGVEGTAGAQAAAALDATLWDLAESLRLLSVLLHPFIPQTAAAIRGRLGLAAPEIGTAARSPDAAGEAGLQTRVGREPVGVSCWGLTVVAGAPLFPAHRRLTGTVGGRAHDSHTHLDHCKEEASLVEDAGKVGVTSSSSREQI